MYSEMNPLHLPEVLALIGRSCGQEELFAALKTSIIGLFSTVNMKKCVLQERAYYAAKIAEYKAKLEELDAKALTMEEESEQNVTRDRRHRSTKGLGYCSGGSGVEHYP